MGKNEFRQRTQHIMLKILNADKKFFNNSIRTGVKKMMMQRIVTPGLKNNVHLGVIEFNFAVKSELEPSGGNSQIFIIFDRHWTCASEYIRVAQLLPTM